MKIGRSQQDNKKVVKKNGKKRSMSGKGSSEIVRALVDRALTDAEQLVESIKLRAEKEAADEIARIKKQAVLDDTDISPTVIELEKFREVIEPEQTEAQQQEQSILTADPEPVTEEISETVAESPASEPEEPGTETVSEPVSETGSDEEIDTIVAEDETSATETESSSVEKPADGTNKQADTETEENTLVTKDMDRNALYANEVELVISTPVDPAAVSRLYNSLQMTPEIKIMYTTGSWDKGTIITVDLEKPLPLLDIISGIKELEVTTLESQDNDLSVKPSKVLMGGNKKNIKRIDLLLKAK